MFVIPGRGIGSNFSGLVQSTQQSATNWPLIGRWVIIILIIIFLYCVGNFQVRWIGVFE